MSPTLASVDAQFDSVFPAIPTPDPLDQIEAVEGICCDEKESCDE